MSNIHIFKAQSKFRYSRATISPRKMQPTGAKLSWQRRCCGGFLEFPRNFSFNFSLITNLNAQRPTFMCWLLIQKFLFNFLFPQIKLVLISQRFY